MLHTSNAQVSRHTSSQSTRFSRLLLHVDPCRPLIFKTGIAVEILILRPLKGGGLLIRGLHSGQGLRELSFRAYRGLLWRKEFNLESGGEVWHLQTSKYCWNTAHLK